MDGTMSTVSERVIERVAATGDGDALELPPLYEYVDPDALDALTTEMTNGTISFTYAGHEITVESDGQVRVDDGPRCRPSGAVGDD